MDMPYRSASLAGGRLCPYPRQHGPNSQVVMQANSRPQTKGKVEKAIPFIERDVLGVQARQVKDLDELNRRGEDWHCWYNKREHEGIQARPVSRYRPSAHRLQNDVLWEAFAREERR